MLMLQQLYDDDDDEQVYIYTCFVVLHEKGYAGYHITHLQQSNKSCDTVSNKAWQRRVRIINILV